jgi:saccharopine dehydrogenase-like NADP-dependent oxidoreductase
MKRVLVLGAGKVGKAAGELLLGAGAGEYSVTLADRDEANLRTAEVNLQRLKKAVQHPAEYALKRVDVADPAAVRSLMTGHDYVVCMLPFNFVAGVAEVANELGVHYFDVTEDVETTDRVRAIAAKAKVALVPQCGLAPGYIAVAANDIARDFTEVHDLVLRVGALPQFPTNMLKYNITWSTAGVVNEYCEPCRAMLGGKPVAVPAMEGLENFSFEGVEYEAFYTSGGVGSLIESLQEKGKVTPETRIAYKTIRYPGHNTLMKFLLQDLRLGAEYAPSNPRGRQFDRALAVDLLDHGLAATTQDVVVVFVNCVGIKDGRREQVNLKRAIRARELWGRVWPAIELTTAAGVCGMMELHRTGKLPQAGLVKQEDATLAMFQATEFGRLGFRE